MPKYNVPMTTWANITVEVETDEIDPNAIVELAAEEAHASLCHQCAGRRNNSLDIGDEWEPVHHGENQAPEVYRLDD